MFRTSLFISTALVLAGWANCVSCNPAIADGSRMQHALASHDANAEFLCHYGHVTVSGYDENYASSSYVSDWTHAAVPIVGRGHTVGSITVAEEGAGTYAHDFSAGIYSNTASGFPGTLIAGGSGLAIRQCGKVTIPIAQTRLLRGQRYWIEETDPFDGHSKPAKVHWALDPRTKHRAYVQYHRAWQEQSKGSSYTSPWAEQSAGPWFRLR